MSGQPDDMFRWPSPEYQTVSRVCETGLNVRVFQPQEEWIDDQFLEIGGQELCSLLLVPFGPMRGIECPDLSLRDGKACQTRDDLRYDGITGRSP